MYKFPVLLVIRHTEHRGIKFERCVAMRALIILAAVFGTGFSGVPLKNKCIKDGDVAFVMDVGGHVDAEELSDLKSAITDAASYLAVGPKKAQVAVATFGGRGPIAFANFFKATSSAKIARRIARIQPVTGGRIRFAGHALGSLSRIMFREVKGDRSDRQNYMMVVMTGPSQKLDQLKAKAAQLTTSGVIVVALGIGEDIPQEQLEMVASDPRLVFKYANSTVFKQKFPHFFKRVVVHCNCMKKADILFMMDTSEGATMKALEGMKSAVKNVTSWVQVGNKNAKIALASFGGGIKTGFNFRWRQNNKNVQNAIGHFSKMAGKERKMFKLFRYFDKIFSAKKGARDDVDQYIVIFVCGPSHRADKFMRKAKKYAMMNNKMIIAVAVGNTVPEDQLQRLASEPTMAIRIRGVRQLPVAVEKIKEIALNCR